MQKLMIAVIAASLLSGGLAGCISTEETALAPNIVRLDTNAFGAPYIWETTLRRAAYITVRSGYSEFRLTPLYVVTPFDYGVMVVMFHAGDPGAWGTYNAQEVLAK